MHLDAFVLSICLYFLSVFMITLKAMNRILEEIQIIFWMQKNPIFNAISFTKACENKSYCIGKQKQKRPVTRLNLT